MAPLLRMGQGADMGFAAVFVLVGPVIGLGFPGGAFFLFQLSRWKGG